MKQICILVPETAVPAAIVDPRYMFSAVNQFFREAGHDPFFDIKLVGLRPTVELEQGLISVHPDLLIDEVKQTDLIVVPAISGDVRRALELNKDFLPWMRELHSRGAEVAGLCIGAFLLGAAGLLDAKTSSTHWLFATQFREMFPQVHLAHDKVVTDQDGVYTSGGAQSYWNLLLYLVEKFTSREMALIASKFFELDTARYSQSPFVMFKGQKEHGDQEVLQAQEFIESHFRGRIHVGELASRFGIGRRTFERRFKKHTSNTVVEYIQRVRIEAAKQQLESGHKSVHEVMQDVGYSDPRAFRDLFRKEAGLSPTEYRSKYSMISVPD